MYNSVLKVVTKKFLEEVARELIRNTAMMVVGEIVKDATDYTRHVIRERYVKNQPQPQEPEKPEEEKAKEEPEESKEEDQGSDDK